MNFNEQIDTVKNIKGDLKSQEMYKIRRILFFKNYFYEVEGLGTIYEYLSLHQLQYMT